MRNIRKLFIIGLSLWIIAGCSKSPQEIMDQANQEREATAYDAAVENYRMLVEQFPEDSLASVAQYRLARLYLDQIDDLNTGIEELKTVIDRFPKSLQAERAKQDLEHFPQWVFGKVEAYRTAKRYNEAIELLKYLINRYPEEPIAAKAQYMIGDVYMNEIRDFDSALQAYRTVTVDYTGQKEEAHAQFMLGYIYANVLNNFEEARKEYQIFIRKFPQNDLVPSVKFELDNLGKDINEIDALKHIAS